MQLVHCVRQLQALQEARALAVAGDAEVLQDRRAQVAGGAAQPQVAHGASALGHGRAPRQQRHELARVIGAG